MIAADLVQELRRRRVSVSVDEGRLKVRAPKGAVDEPLRRALVERKLELCAHLQEQARVLDMSLDEFTRANLLLEFWVPGCAQTLWWVPDDRGVKQLMRRGVGRGRIWTAEELQRLWQGPDLRQEHAQTLSRIKSELGCELRSITPPTGDPSGLRR